MELRAFPVLGRDAPGELHVVCHNDHVVPLLAVARVDCVSKVDAQIHPAIASERCVPWNSVAHSEIHIILVWHLQCPCALRRDALLPFLFERCAVLIGPCTFAEGTDKTR
eukprot:1147173-Rhodomonas_salina.1